MAVVRDVGRGPGSEGCPVRAGESTLRSAQDLGVLASRAESSDSAPRRACDERAHQGVEAVVGIGNFIALTLRDVEGITECVYQRSQYHLTALARVGVVLGLVGLILAREKLW